MKRYSVTGLEGRNAKSKCNHGHASSRSTGKRPFFASSSLACQCSRRCAWTSPVAARVTFWFLFLFSCPVVSDFVTLWTAACQASLSLTISQICPSSCPLHGWCHPPISSFDAPFSCPQSFPTSGTFPMSIQGWFPLRLTGLISLLSKGLSRVFSSTTVWRYQFFGILPSLWSSSHNHTWPLGIP